MVLHFTCVVVANIVCITIDPLLNALQWLGTPEVILKPEQQSVMVKFACALPINRVWEVTCAFVCLDSMLEKCVADFSGIITMECQNIH